MLFGVSVTLFLGVLLGPLRAFASLVMFAESTDMLNRFPFYAGSALLLSMVHFIASIGLLMRRVWGYVMVHVALVFEFFVTCGWLLDGHPNSPWPVHAAIAVVVAVVSILFVLAKTRDRFSGTVTRNISEVFD